MAAATSNGNGRASGIILPSSVRSVDLTTRGDGARVNMRQRPRRPVQTYARTSSARPVVVDDPFGEIGTSGLRQYGGFVLEEWLAKLRGRFGAWAYRELIDNSPIAGGIIFAIKMLARECEWAIEDDIPIRGQDLGFVDSCRNDMSHTWLDFVSEALSMIGYGWALHEEVFKRREGERPLPMVYDELGDYRMGVPETEEDAAYTPPSSKYDDGLIGWRRLPVRAQETLMRWRFAGYSSLRGMEQVDWHGGKHTIGMGKALLFRTETTRNNPEGRSLLRNAWTSWYAIHNIQTIEAIGIERDLAGIPVLTPPDGVDLSQPAFKNLLEVAEDLVQGIRRDEDEGVVLPQAGWKLELLSTGGSRQIDTDAVIRRYEQRMTVSVLADFLILGQDSLGSYAMVDVKSDLFGIAVDALLNIICDVINRYAIPRLLHLNGMHPAKMPKLTHSSVGRIDLRMVGEFLSNMSLAGMPIPWTEPLVQHLFRGAALPSPEFDGKLLSPAQPSPAAHDSQWRPSWGSEDQTTTPTPPTPPVERDHIAKADQQTGAMVALYPAPDIARHLQQNGGEPAHELHLTLAFLGDASSLKDVDRLREVIAGFAASTPPIQGRIAGTGIFTAGPENVLYAAPDAPELSHVRQRLVDALEHAGFPPSREHGFTPHITLAYDHKGGLPAVANVPLTFDHVTLAIAGTHYDYPLSANAVVKAEPHGETVDMSPILKERANQLSAQLEREMLSALDLLGNQAGTAYASIAEKSLSPRDLQRLVGRVVAQAKVGSWVRDHLMPLLHNHAARVTADTKRVVEQRTQQDVKLPESEVARIASTAGQRLKVRDIEPQVREAISEAIAEGLLAGENPTKTARRIREKVPKGRFVHAGAPWRAQLIARDQTANLQREATLAAYSGMRNVGNVEAIDGIYGPPRSDEQCIHRSGTVLPIEQARATVHALHPLCTLGFNPVVRTPVAEPELLAAA